MRRMKKAINLLVMSLALILSSNILAGAVKDVQKLLGAEDYYAIKQAKVSLDSDITACVKKGVCANLRSSYDGYQDTLVNTQSFESYLNMHFQKFMMPSLAEVAAEKVLDMSEPESKWSISIRNGWNSMLSAMYVGNPPCKAP